MLLCLIFVTFTSVPTFFGILEVSILRKCIFHNAGDNFLCNLDDAASAYELLVKLSYNISLWRIPQQTDDDDDGRTTDDDDDDDDDFSNMFYDCYWF